MFPLDQYRSSVTVFTPFYSGEKKAWRFYRTVLKRCFWKEDSITVTKAGGVSAPESVEINIPIMYNLSYVNRVQWAKYANEPPLVAWSICTGGETERSIILRGKASMPELEEWASRDAFERLIIDLRRGTGQERREPTDVNEILFGPLYMRRIIVQC